MIVLFLIDLKSELWNFADSNAKFARGNSLEEEVIKLDDDLCMTLEWFS